MIVFSRRAREELLEAFGYILFDDQAAADREIDRILAALRLLAEQKVDGREVVLQSGQRLRLWLVAPYRVYYRRQGDTLQVVRVYHQARRPIER